MDKNTYTELRHPSSNLTPEGMGALTLRDVEPLRDAALAY